MTERDDLMHDDGNSSVALEPHMMSSLPFVVDEQRVTVHRVDFSTRSIFLSTELDIRVQYGYPGTATGAIALNCRQAAILAVRVNGEVTTSFLYSDPWTLTDGFSEGGGGDEPPPTDTESLLKRMAVAAESTDSESQNGELWLTNLFRPPLDQRLVEIATSDDPDTSAVEDAVVQLEWVPMTIAIDYALEQPECGIVFVLPRDCQESGTESNSSLVQRGAHVYTISTASARDWLPCVDSPSCLCKWRIEFHLPSNLVPVSCGEHLSTENDSNGDRVYAYSLTLPVPPSLIGFAIGGFQSVTDEHMNEIQHYCLPGGIVTLLEPTTECLQTVFEFFEENLACTYPFPAYRQVYVHSPPKEVMSFASFSILSTATLTTADSIEGQMATRRLHAEALAKQYFGCVVIAEASSSSLTSRLSPSWWLVPSLARFLTSLYSRRAFGNNEDKSWVAAENTALADFERTRLNGNALQLDVQSTAFEMEPYSEMAIRKGTLILRLIELRITHERFLHVLSVLLTKSAKREMAMLTRNDFVQNVSNISGTQIAEFMNRFEGSASIRLTARYAYSRRRSALQVTLQQQNGPTMYAGPVSIAIQETDGPSQHVVQMSGRTVSVELPINSKPKKTRKRHVVLTSGEEVDIDLTGADIDCIMLWLRVDPNYALLRATSVIHQPDYAWQFQLELDRDVCGQFEAASALKQYPTPVARARLEAAILNDQFFYRVRGAAALSLAENLILTAQNTAASGGVAPPDAQSLIWLFKRLFCSRNGLPRPNNFTNIQSYFVQMSLIEAIAMCNSRDGLDFLYSLVTYNDNSRNKFSDAVYVAHMCLQLASCVPPAPSRMLLSDSAAGNLNLGPSTPPGIALGEVVTRLNIDTLPSPSAGFVISRACLSAIRLLQSRGHLPNNSNFFEPYINLPTSKHRGSLFPGLRMEAFRCLLECILSSKEVDEEAAADLYSDAVIEMASKEEDLSVRFYVADLLLSEAMKRPGPGGKSYQEARALLSRLLPQNALWNAVLLANEIRIRSRLSSIFSAMYGDEAADVDGRSASVTIHESGMSLSPPPVLKKKSKKDKTAAVHEPQPEQSRGLLDEPMQVGEGDGMSYFD